MPKAAKKPPKKQLTISTGEAPKPKATPSAESFARGGAEGRTTERVSESGAVEVRVTYWMPREVHREIRDQAYARRVPVQVIINERLSRG